MGDVACRVPNYRSSSYPLGGSSLMTQINTWDIGFFSFFLLYVQGKCMCKHMEARRQPQVCPQECCPLLWPQCLPLSRNSPIRQAWLAGEPQWSFALHSHSSGITSAYHHTWHFYVGSRNQIQVHRLDKRLTYRAISLSLSSRSANKAPCSERLELLCLQNGPALAEMSPLRLERAGSLSSSLFGAMYSQSVLGQQPMEKYHISMCTFSAPASCLLPPFSSSLASSALITKVCFWGR